MKRCMLCCWILQKRRWLALIPLMLFTLLTPLFAPVWLFLLLLSAQLLLSALCAVYLHGTLAAWSPDHLRMPAPRDGQAEIVMVDAALIDHGPAVLRLMQPVHPAAPGAPLRGEGVQHLAMSLCLLSRALPRSDAHALDEAAKRHFGLDSRAVISASRILRHGRENGLAFVTVQDGADERTYFTGAPEAILDVCSAVWEGDEHLLGADDRSRILTAAREASSAGEHLHAFATALNDEDATFLGLVSVGDEVDALAVQQLQTLHDMGITLILRDDGTQYMDVPVLRRNLDIPDLHTRPDIHLCITRPYPDVHTLAIIRHQNRTLDEPVLELREHFATLGFKLERLSGVMALCLLSCVLVGGLHSALAVAAVLIAAYLSFGSLLSARAIRPFEMLLTGGACLLIRLLMNATVPAAQDFAGTLLCLTMAALISLTLATPGHRFTFRKLAPMLAVALVAVALQVIRSWAVIAVALLPALFAVVCGAIIGLLFLFTGR